MMASGVTVLQRVVDVPVSMTSRDALLALLGFTNVVFFAGLPNKVQC
jgi:hypothetical protein